MKKFLAKLREPIFTNRGLDLLAVLSWLCFAWWGIASVFVSIPSIARAADGLYELAWGAGIGVLALMAAIAAASTFFTIPHVSRVVKKQIEMVCLYPMAGLISVYPAVVITQAAAGNPDLVAVSGIAVYYLAFPIFRIVHLNGRIKALLNSQNGKPFSDETG